MDECAECGARVDGAAAYCDDCADRGGGRAPTDRDRGGAGARTVDRDGGADGVTTVDRGGGHGAVASPAERAVAALLGVAAVVGGFSSVESLSFLPEALGFLDPVETGGFLLNTTVRLGLAAAFAVGAKRLADGTADAGRIGRALRSLAVVSVVLTGVAVLAPFGVLRWVPSVLDPGAIVVAAAVRYVTPGPVTVDPALLGIAGVGAVVSFAAGTALATDR